MSIVNLSQLKSVQAEAAQLRAENIALRAQLARAKAGNAAPTNYDEAMRHLVSLGAMNRKDFDAMPTRHKGAYFIAGGSITNEPGADVAAAIALLDTVNTKTLAEFQTLSHDKRNEFMRNGGRIRRG